MPPLEILLVRHGETAWNAERRLQGHLDIGLNEQGMRQAAAVGHALRNTPLDAIWSSDLQRAAGTAGIIAAPRGMTVGLDAGLRERCYGAFEGLLYAELAGRYPDAYRAMQAREIDARYPPGLYQAETLREFSQRSLATIDRLAASCHGPHRRIVLVTHGGVLECAHRAATETLLSVPRDFAIPNASVNRLRWSASEGLQILDWADIAHLTRDALDEIAN